MPSDIILGGISEVKELTELVKDICDQIRTQVESKQNSQFSEFVPINYKSQMVNGTNYFIKVRTEPSKHVHLRVHRTFQGDLTLAGVHDGKTLEDEIEYF